MSVLLGLVGLVFQVVAVVVSRLQRVRMALPLPVESSPIWLIVLGLICEAIGGLMMVL